MWDLPSGAPLAGLWRTFWAGSKDRLRVYRTCTIFPGQQDQSDVAYETQAQHAHVRLGQAGYTAMKIRRLAAESHG